MTSNRIFELSEIPTLRELYNLGTLVPPASESVKAPPADSLLDRVSLIQADITKLRVDAIVNAANQSLLGGGGVDGVIHRAAGRQLLEECATLNGCPTGNAKMTKGYKLPARHVIHTVGPIYSRKADQLGKQQEQLRSCYRRCLELAKEASLKHVAFCSISTGIYGYPIEDATYIALSEARAFLDADSSLERVIFVVFPDRDRDVYGKLIPLYFPPSSSVPQSTENEEVDKVQEAKD